MDDLVVSPLQKGRVDGRHRDHALAGQAGRKGDGVLLGHSHVKEPVAESVPKELQPGAVLHGGGDGADLPVSGRGLAQCFAEHGRERGRRGHFRVRHKALAPGRNAVELAGVFLRRQVALALGGDHMEEKRPRPDRQVAQGLFQFQHLVPVQRAQILEAHILKHGGVVHGPPDDGLGPPEKPVHRLAHHRHPVQRLAQVPVDPEIFRAGPQMGQVAGHGPHVFGDGHPVVVQDDHEVIEGGNIVHPLVDHPAGESAVPDDGHHPAGLPLQLFGPGHADGQREGRIAVAGHKGVVPALPRVGEPRDAVLLAQPGKARLAAGEQFVGVALVPHVKDDLVLGGVQHPVQGHRQLDGAQVGSQMPAGAQDAVHQKAADLPAQLHHLFVAQALDVLRPLDAVQQRRIHSHRRLSPLRQGLPAAHATTMDSGYKKPTAAPTIIPA